MDNFSPEALARGYVQQDGGWTCVYCGERFAHGEVFPIDGRFFDAGRAAELHVRAAHPDRMEELFRIGGKRFSLTDNQRELLRLFAAGLSDQEIAARQGVAASTVRHQRFTFRERARSARLFLAAWQLAEEGRDQRAALLPVHEGATMVDERYELTEEEYRKILNNVFESLEPLRLKVFSAREKKKIATLRRIAQEFEPGRQYSEREVNAILKPIYADFATLRRELIEYGYLSRTPDCSAYWKN